MLEELGVRPNQNLGQNFLIDANILDILISYAQLDAGDRVMEVGPGLGIVTERLVASCGFVLAVERDRRLYSYLAERLPQSDRLDLICSDVLAMDPHSVERYRIGKIVSNLPYAAGNRFLMRVFREGSTPGRIVVTVQKETAQRLAAAPGTRAFGLLSAWAQLDYRVGIVKIVKPTCFWPRPKVDSAIVEFERQASPLTDAARRQRFHELTKCAFTLRRKQLGTILGRPGILPGEAPGDVRRVLQSAGIDPKHRPEDVSIEAWCRLVEALETS